MFSGILRSRPANVLADLIIASVLVLVPAYVAYDYLRTQQRPRVIKSIWIDPAVAPQGSVITVRIRAAMTRICDAQVHRWILRASDNRPVWTVVEPGRVTQVSDDTVISVQIQLDEAIAPGDYYYKSVVYDTCPDARAGQQTFTASPPFAYFKVVPR